MLLYINQKNILTQGRMDWKKFKLTLESKTNLKIICLKLTDDIDYRI